MNTKTFGDLLAERSAPKPEPVEREHAPRAEVSLVEEGGERFLVVKAKLPGADYVPVVSSTGKSILLAGANERIAIGGAKTSVSFSWSMKRD